MKLAREGRSAVTTGVLVVALLAIAFAGVLSFYVFSSIARSSQTGSATASSSTSTALTTTSTSSASTGDTSQTTSTTSSRSSTTSSRTTSSTGSSSTSSSTSSSSTFVLPSGASEVVIPLGIQSPDAQARNITFDPYNLTVQVGVNNTIYFVNEDLNYSLGHVIESTSWPTNGQVFAFPILPGQVYNITLTTPGTYTYNCEWHPVWMTGTITVLPPKS